MKTGIVHQCRLLPFFAALLPPLPFFPSNTRAKILSTFFSWRGRSKAYSICRRGTQKASYTGLKPLFLKGVLTRP